MKMMMMLLLLQSLLCVAVSSSESSPSARKSVFILAGQSNMAGEGGRPNGALSPTDKWDHIIPKESASNPSILRLNASSMEWEEAHEPLHGGGVGPAMAFSNALLKREPSIGVIGLVPCAIPGSFIDTWGQNKSNYITMLAQARAAITVANGGVLRGFLWYQGESDSRDKALADSYKGKLLDLFNRVRADLHSPQLPIIQVALASGYNFTDTVRQAQLHTKLPYLKCVDAKGLELEPPRCNMKPVYNQSRCLHLSTRAQVRLGAKLAHAFLHGFE